MWYKLKPTNPRQIKCTVKLELKAIYVYRHDGTRLAFNEEYGIRRTISPGRFSDLLIPVSELFDPNPT
ncbi:hypothetical protein [Kyrpidia spormannii]|uniref:Uncharacterized protein n=2 Tax=Kyrpidia spormannii TaxID=2055160 RepID=A0ACA8ZA15_9BACL|nr:hypothetical protein [Kyrpidia spormannii]CAB3392874.1 protein of unknown function [Kyrpidia spormannii]CAB3393792.1 protein of unknown function [Kyrpidia spormannii]